MFGCACAVLALLIAGCGSGSDDSAQTTSVSTDTAPTIAGTPQSSVSVGLIFGFNPVADDPNDDNLVFTIQNKPDWAVFNMGTGILSGEPDFDDVGVYSNIVISVTDGSESAALPPFNIEVLGAATGAATLTWLAPTANEDNSALTDLSGYKVHYGTSPGDYPNTSTIHNEGVTSHMVENLPPDTWYFVVTAFDHSGNESEFSEVVSKVVL